jgi:hypothetical protein
MHVFDLLTHARAGVALVSCVMHRALRGKMCTGIVFAGIWLNFMLTRTKLRNRVGKFPET